MRFRGKRRYYRQLLQRAQQFMVPSCSEEWHIHVTSRREPGSKGRRQHLQALFMMLERAHEQLAGTELRETVTASVDLRDPFHDAISCSATTTVDIEWDAPLPAMLAPFITAKLQAGRFFDCDNNAIYVARLRAAAN